MQVRQKQIIEAYQRVQAFLGAHPVEAPASYLGPKQVLDDVVAQLTSHSSAQVSGRQLTRSEKRRLDALMQKLRDHHMRPLVRIAKLAIQPEPGVAEKLRMPQSGRTFVNLLAASRAMREAAAPYQANLIAAGLPQDFLERFAAAEDAVRASALTRGTNFGLKAGAGAGLDAQIKRGRSAVEALDAIVRMAFEANDVVLAEWRVARRVKALPTGGRVEAGAVPPTSPEISPAAA